MSNQTTEERITIDQIRDFAEQHDCNIRVIDGKVSLEKRSNTIWKALREFFDVRRN